MEYETRGYMLIIIGAIVFLIAAVVFFSSGISLSEPTTELEECKTLQYNGEGRIDLLFFGDEKVASEYTDFLFGSEPFTESAGAFNVFYIDTYQPKCELYKGIAILCHSRELVKKAASCPHDYIVVLEDRDESIRSSAYLNVMSLNQNHLLTVFLHELGHVLANLAEEYINNQNPPRGSRNCVNACPSFNGKEDGCFEGCSLTNLYRSIEEGVMRTLHSAEFGGFNVALLKAAIEKQTDFSEESGITGNVVRDGLSCQNEEYILVEVRNEEVSKTVHRGCGGSNGEGPNTFEVYEDNEIINQGEFNAQIFTDVQLIEEDQLSGETFVDESQSILLSLPVEGENIALFDEEGVEIIQTSLHDAGARPCLI